MTIKIGRNWLVLPFVYLISLAIGLYIGIKLLLEIWSEGKDQVLRVKPRNKPNILTDEKYGKHCYTVLPKSKIRLHYVINGATDKPLMVFLHGFPQCWYTWRHQMINLSKDYRTVAVDLRGFGESDKPKWLPRYDMEEVADDIRQLVEILDYQTCIVVGHDLGGIVGWIMAARYPQLVSNLIVMNTPHLAAQWEMANIDPIYSSRYMWRRFLYVLPVLPVLYMMSRDNAQLVDLMTGSSTGAKPDTYTEQDIEVYKYTYSTYDDWRAALSYYKAAALCNLPLFKNHRIMVPSMMIWGAREQMVPMETAVLTKKRVEQYQITGTLGGTYWVHEEEPQQINEYIREYLTTGKVINLAKRGDIFEITKGFAT